MQASSRQMKPEHKLVAREIYAIITTLSGETYDESCPERYGIFGSNYLSDDDGTELIFDSGYPSRLVTREASYVLLTSGYKCFDTELFWQMLNQSFDVEILKPRASRKEARRLQHTGPHVKLRPR